MLWVLLVIGGILLALVIALLITQTGRDLDAEGNYVPGPWTLRHDRGEDPYGANDEPAYEPPGLLGASPYFYPAGTFKWTPEEDYAKPPMRSLPAEVALRHPHHDGDPWPYPSKEVVHVGENEVEMQFMSRAAYEALLTPKEPE